MQFEYTPEHIVLIAEGAEYTLLRRLTKKQVVKAASGGMTISFGAANVLTSFLQSSTLQKQPIPATPADIALYQEVLTDGSLDEPTKTMELSHQMILALGVASAGFALLQTLAAIPDSVPEDF